MGNPFKGVWQVFSALNYSKKTLTIVGIIAIAAIIPVTVLLSQQQQEIRQRASTVSMSCSTIGTTSCGNCKTYETCVPSSLGPMYATNPKPIRRFDCCSTTTVPTGGFSCQKPGETSNYCMQGTSCPSNVPNEVPDKNCPTSSAGLKCCTLAPKEVTVSCPSVYTNASKNYNLLCQTTKPTGYTSLATTPIAANTVYKSNCATSCWYKEITASNVVPGAPENNPFGPTEGYTCAKTTLYTDSACGNKCGTGTCFLTGTNEYRCCDKNDVSESRYSCNRCSNVFKYYYASWNSSAGNCENETNTTDKIYTVNCGCPNDPQSCFTDPVTKVKTCATANYSQPKYISYNLPVPNCPTAPAKAACEEVGVPYTCRVGMLGGCAPGETQTTDYTCTNTSAKCCKAPACIQEGAACTGATGTRCCTGLSCSTTSRTCIKTPTPTPTTAPTRVPTAVPTAVPTSATCPPGTSKTPYRCSGTTCSRTTSTTCISDSCNPANANSCGGITSTPLPPGTTSLSLILGLDGIGTTGDNANPTLISGSNKNPGHPSRNISVVLVNNAGQALAEKTGQAVYDGTSSSSTYGKFKATIDLGTISTGSYTIKVTSPVYLTTLVSSMATINSGTTNTAPTARLTTGNINNEALSKNTLDIMDYNILLGCVRDETITNIPAAFITSCNSTASNTTLSDLDDNGAVDRNDWNLWIRELGHQLGAQ